MSKICEFIDQIPMKIVLVYLPFCTPVSPPYSLTNLHSFLSHNSKQEIKVLDLNAQFHTFKFPEYKKYFQSSSWNDYEKIANEYHQLTKKTYSENNKKIVGGEKPEYFTDLLAKIRNEKPDVVAFSIVYSSQTFYAHALLKELGEVKTVVGGPSVNTKLGKLADHHFKNELEFLNFIEGKKIKHSELVFDFPLDFSIYNLEDYFTPQTVIPIKTSTTCYYQQCTFCAHYAKVPYQEYLLENIENTVVTSRMKHFFLIDDMIPVKRLLELGKIFKGAKWSCQLRPTKEFTIDILKELHKSGLTFVLWGVESGCQKTLDAIKKGTKVEDVEVVLHNSHVAGIKNVIYTMFGFPGETESDFMETIKFLKRNDENIDLISGSVFGLHKGAKVYDNPGKFGITEVIEEDRTILEPKISYTVKDGLSNEEAKKRKKRYSPVIDSVNKYPKTMNFFREHMFFMDN